MGQDNIPRRLWTPQILVQWFRYEFPKLVHLLDAAGRVLHRSFYCYYRQDPLGKIVHASISFAIFWAWYLVLFHAHENLLPESWRQWAFFSFAVRTVLSLVTVATLSVPLVLVRLHDKKSKYAARHLHEALVRSSRDFATRDRKSPVDEALVEEIITTAGDATSEMFILTPNGFFWVADRFEKELSVVFKSDPGMLKMVEHVHRNSERFRNALEAYPGELHVFLPDIQDQVALSMIVARAGHTGLKQELLLAMIRRALLELSDIKKARKKKKLVTGLYRVPFLPELRVLLSGSAATQSGRCFIQAVPPKGLRITNDVTCVSSGQSPDQFAAQFAMMHALCETI